MPSGIPTKEERHAKEMILAALENDYGGNTTKAAKDFGVSQGYMSDVRSLKKPVGLKLIKGFANVKGLPYTEVLGISAAPNQAMAQDLPEELRRVVDTPPPKGRAGTTTPAILAMCLESYRADGQRRTEEEWTRVIDDLIFVRDRAHKATVRVVHDDPTKRTKRKRKKV